VDFVAVAEEANFTRAAERVHISQSGVSAQVKQLERELGAPLIAAHPLVCLPAGTGVRTALDRSCAALGQHPTVALQASAPTAVTDLARRGLGVGILSESMLTGSEGLIGLTIGDADVVAVRSLVWRPAPGPALRALLRHCHNAFTAV